MRVLLAAPFFPSSRGAAFALPGPTGLRPCHYHAARGNPPEEVRDGPHGANRAHNRGGGNRCGVAPTAAPLRPWAGTLCGPSLYNAHIMGRAMMFPILPARPFAFLRSYAAGRFLCTG